MTLGDVLPGLAGHNETSIELPAFIYDRLRRATGRLPRYLEDLHGKQKAFVLDRSSRKLALCGRRSGKSVALAFWFLQGMEEKPGTRSVYVTLNRPKARQVLWDGVLNSPKMRHYNFPVRLATVDGQLMVTHKNGSTLWLMGCSSRSEHDKLRGESFYRVAVDEVQAFPDAWVEEMIEESIDPALMDLNGQLAICGTPSPRAVGYFFDADQAGKGGYQRHHWTVLDNTHMENPAAYIAKKRFELGWAEDHPTLRREYLGEWVNDLGALIYPFQTERNAWVPDESLGTPYGLPLDDYTYGLGVDLGFGEKSTAFVLVASGRSSGICYVLSAYKRSRLIPTALAAHVQGVKEKVAKETGGKGLRIVVDEGALGRGYAEQMREMGVGCEAAQKSEKRAYQESVQGLILSASLKVDYGTPVKKPCQELLEETAKLPFDSETGLEDSSYANHACDSMLYIVRALMPRYNPEENPPTPGSAEAINLEMRRHKQQLIKERERKRRGGSFGEMKEAA